MDAAPWRDEFARHVLDVASHAADLGGIPLTGSLGELQAFSAGRDGVHLVVRVGDRVAWARGLRDGSVHGLNLLANALAADAVAWPTALRETLAQAQARLTGAWVPGDGPRIHATKYLVRPRGASGFEVIEP